MTRIAYVNGSYVPHRSAAVHIEDRGYQFADGVYEVFEIRDNAVIDETRHLDRLGRSLSELAIAMPMPRNALAVVLHETARRNRVRDGIVYLQVTRGVAPRDHGFPDPAVRSALVMTAHSHDRAAHEALAQEGASAITLADNRWDRVDIKSIGLLPNVLAKQTARAKGAREALFVDAEGFITEGSSTNAWIVTMDGRLVTRPAEHGILRGITRQGVLDIADRLGLTVEERAFTVEEAKAAREVFITAASTIVMPIVRIDEATIGNGAPGSTALRMRHHFHDAAERTPL